MEQPWGFHYMADCLSCDIAKIKSKENVENFARELVKAIDMVAYGDPQVVHFGSGNKEGFTLVQLIETSNITGHFCNDTGDAYIDVFSCKYFDREIVRRLILEFFYPLNVMSTSRYRDANRVDNVWP